MFSQTPLNTFELYQTFLEQHQKGGRYVLKPSQTVLNNIELLSN